jgi:hypothetical protein
VIFGYFGKHVNITDGRYVYMRAGRNEELNEYTLMPTHIFTPFTKQELQNADRQLTDSFAFTGGIPVMRIPASTEEAPNNSCYWYDIHMKYGNLLFDLEEDPYQEHPIQDNMVEKRMTDALIQELDNSEAPEEQYRRLALG